VTAATATRNVSEQLARRLGERKFEMWFGPTTRMAIRGQRLEVRAATPSVAEWIGTHFAGDLRAVATSTLGDGAVVDVSVDESIAVPRPAPAAAPRREAPARKGGASSPPMRHSLDDFVVGDSNRLAYSSARHVADATARGQMGPLVIYGECGLGKTHLLQGVCRRVFEHTPGAKVRYVTGEQFTNEYIAAVKSGDLEPFRKRSRHLDLLAIDDIHFLANKTATQAEFLHTLDAIDLGGARVVMASDEHPQHLKSINRALVSRFMAGLVVEIERPDRGMRVELVRRLARARGLDVNEQAIDMIASRCVGSVREIEGVVTRLSAMVLLTGDGPGGGEIGCVAVERLFKSNTGEGKPVRIQTIVEVVCRRLGVERSDLLGSTRHHRVVIARAVVSYLARELTTLSFPEIGRALGRRNHSTVLTASRRLSDQIAAGEPARLDENGSGGSLAELVDHLRHEVKRAARG
jgi:chromosomal replication initiator protein